MSGSDDVISRGPTGRPCCIDAAATALIAEYGGSAEAEACRRMRETWEANSLSGMLGAMEWLRVRMSIRAARGQSSLVVVRDAILSAMRFAWATNGEPARS